MQCLRPWEPFSNRILEPRSTPKKCRWVLCDPPYFPAKNPTTKAASPNTPCSSRFGFPYLCQLQRPVGEFLFFLEGDPVDLGLSLGELGQLLLEGVLLLQVMN
jgi:hypothetical protein